MHLPARNTEGSLSSFLISAELAATMIGMFFPDRMPGRWGSLYSERQGLFLLVCTCVHVHILSRVAAGSMLNSHRGLSNSCENLCELQGPLQKGLFQRRSCVPYPHRHTYTYTLTHTLARMYIYTMPYALTCTCVHMLP